MLLGRVKINMHVNRELPTKRPHIQDDSSHLLILRLMLHEKNIDEEMLQAKARQGIIFQLFKYQEKGQGHSDLF